MTIALLRARRHAGRRAGALHVEDHRGDLGEIGEPEEFLHQRDAGPGGGREGARAVPRRADHHADRGELVLGLHDGEAVLPGVGIDPIARAISGERLGERRGRRDRIPGAHRGAAIDGARAPPPHCPSMKMRSPTLSERRRRTPSGQVRFCSA